MLNDFIENDTHGPVLPNDIYHLDEHCPKCNIVDYTVNKVGGEILRLCIGNRLRILNGRLTDDEILGKPITPKEIHEHISKLKTKKASSMDSILNEMIKHGRYFLLPSLEKIFNDILNSVNSRLNGILA